MNERTVLSKLPSMKVGDTVIFDNDRLVVKSIVQTVNTETKVILFDMMLELVVDGNSN